METCTWIELTGEDDLEPNSSWFKGHEHITEENQNHSYEAPEQKINAMKTNITPLLSSSHEQLNDESNHSMIK